MEEILLSVLNQPVSAGPTPSDVDSAYYDHLLRAGKYSALLSTPLALTLLDASGDATSAEAAVRARAHLDAAEDKPAAASTIVAIGAGALCLFSHANWTGAPVASNAAALGALCEPRDEAALRALAVDGEAAYALLDAPRLLCAARALLVDALDALAPHHSLAAPWWAARCAMLHQRCLDAPAPTLEKEATLVTKRRLRVQQANTVAASHSLTQLPHNANRLTRWSRLYSTISQSTKLPRRRRAQSTAHHSQSAHQHLPSPLSHAGDRCRGKGDQK